MPLVMQSLIRHGIPGLSYSVSEEAQHLLNSYRWPGNVRELENVIQRAVVLCPTELITSDHLMFDEGVSNANTFGTMGGMGGLGNAGNTGNMGQGSNEQAQYDQSAASVFGSMQSHSLNSPVADITSALARNVISNEGAAYLPIPRGAYLPGNNNLSDDAVNGQTQGNPPVDLSSAVKASEHLVIMSAIRTSENRIEAAKKLGISPRTLRYKLAQLRDRGMAMSVSE